jgi:AmmeMemoRadiSam system protein B/AmmeMemoRadiSam system protein A
MKNLTRTSFIIFLMVLMVIACKSQNRTAMKQSEQQLIDREPAVAGSFYSSDPDELKSGLKDFFNKAELIDFDGEVRAIISPHAGYVFSGFVAASGFRQLDPEVQYDRIFVIGSSHHTGFNGASIYSKGNYITPLGEVEVDIDLANQLISEHKCFKYNASAHQREHSLEVQLPFLQYRLKKPFKIIPIVLGSQTPSMSEEIAKALLPYFKDGNLFIISTDLSHYPNYRNAKLADENITEAVLSKSPDKFLKALKENEKENYPNLLTSMCGWPSVLTLLYMTENKHDINYHKVLYLNSGDSRYGDHDRVVGYVSIITTQENNQNKSEFLTEKDKISLLKLARKTIQQKILHNQMPKIDTKEFSQTLLKPAGAFVTLHTSEGKLRGCIGRFQPDAPLYQVVKDMTISSALNDYRFSPVTKDEVPEVDIEISVLTPLKEIHSVEEIELGRHGIYMVKEGRSGTFLPQVAKSTNWTKEEFLGHCAQDKARFGWDGWKDAELYTYEAIIFSEKEMGLKH